MGKTNWNLLNKGIHFFFFTLKSGDEVRPNCKLSSFSKNVCASLKSLILLFPLWSSKKKEDKLSTPHSLIHAVPHGGDAGSKNWPSYLSDKLLSKIQGIRLDKDFPSQRWRGRAPFLVFQRHEVARGRRVQKLEGENHFNKAELLSASSTNYSQGHPGAQHRLPSTGTKMQKNPDHIRQPQKQKAFTASYSGTLMKVEKKTSASISEDERDHTMRGEVEMTRDTRTHDMAMSFIDLYRNRK